METLFKIDACHPILKRVIKSNMNYSDMIVLFKELEEAGYESKNIELTWEHISHCFGCGVKLTNENFPEKLKEISKRTNIEICIECDFGINITKILGDKK